MKTLTPTERRALRAKAHHIEPVVTIGNAGLTPAVLHEIDVNLRAHELLKVRVVSDEREEREAFFGRICEELDAAPVQHIGKLLVLFRERPPETREPSPPLPKSPAKPQTRKGRQQEQLIAARRRPRSSAAPKATPQPKARGRGSAR